MLTACGWPIEPGRRVRLLTSIWDDGSDCHPPGHAARAGDVLYVLRDLRHAGRFGDFAVSHAPLEKTYGSFLVLSDEVELYWEQPDLFTTTTTTTKEK
jgi:hypothetical protein